MIILSVYAFIIVPFSRYYCLLWGFLCGKQNLNLHRIHGRYVLIFVAAVILILILNKSKTNAYHTNIYHTS